MSGAAWLIGAKGMLGQAVARRLDAEGISHIDTDIDVDVTARDAVFAFARAQAPRWVINCAAYTRVDDAEADYARALAVNGEAVAHLADACLEISAGLVHVSTDYVFDGKAQHPYRADDATAPLGAYGRSKLAGEQAIVARIPRGLRGLVVRTSWLFGEGGKNFVLTMLRLIAEREKLRVVADQHGRPTYARDLAQALIALTDLKPAHPAARPGIYHFANGGQVSWHAFTEAIRDVAREHGLPIKAHTIDAISTSEYPLPAPRPAYSVLSTDKIAQLLPAPIRPYRAALNDYISALSATSELPHAKTQ